MLYTSDLDELLQAAEGFGITEPDKLSKSEVQELLELVSQCRENIFKEYMKLSKVLKDHLFWPYFYVHIDDEKFWYYPRMSAELLHELRGKYLGLCEGDIYQCVRCYLTPRI